MTSSVAVIFIFLVLTSAELLPDRRLHAGHHYGVWDGVTRLIKTDTLAQAEDLTSLTSHAIVYVQSDDSTNHDVVWLEVIWIFI